MKINEYKNKIKNKKIQETKLHPIPRFPPGSFAVHIEDHFWFEIICGPIWGSFPVWGSFAALYRPLFLSALSPVEQLWDMIRLTFKARVTNQLVIKDNRFKFIAYKTHACLQYAGCKVTGFQPNCWPWKSRWTAENIYQLEADKAVADLGGGCRGATPPPWDEPFFFVYTYSLLNFFYLTVSDVIL